MHACPDPNLHRSRQRAPGEPVVGRIAQPNGMPPNVRGDDGTSRGSQKYITLTELPVPLLRTRCRGGRRLATSSPSRLWVQLRRATVGAAFDRAVTRFANGRT